MKPDHDNIGIGPTKELNLRVSIASLVSVLVKDPESNKTMIALERAATLLREDGKNRVIVRAKPFGGGVILKDPDLLKQLIGNFNYDSERSREEKDFRIQVNPARWEDIKELCGAHLNGRSKVILDITPDRELREEFEDSLKIKITHDDYSLRQKGMVVENRPTNTDNINAPGTSTVRVYYLFEAGIINTDIIKMLIGSSRDHSDEDLRKTAYANFHKGGKGRANAVLVVDPDKLKEYYRSVPRNNPDGLLQYGDHLLDGNVQVLFEGTGFFTYL
jgi:hypothetical protein